MSAKTYEFHVRGRLTDDVLQELRGLRVCVERPQTVLRGPVRDQAALHGILRRLHGMGIELVEVRELPEMSHE